MFRDFLVNYLPPRSEDHHRRKRNFLFDDIYSIKYFAQGESFQRSNIIFITHDVQIHNPLKGTLFKRALQDSEMKIGILGEL
jgi:hypothetical protein